MSVRKIVKLIKVTFTWSVVKPRFEFKVDHVYIELYILNPLPSPISSISHHCQPRDNIVPNVRQKLKKYYV